MSAEALREALAVLGLRGNIEARGNLAVLSLEGDPARLRDPKVRERAVGIAREHGFTHLALDVTGPQPDDAALHRG